MEMFASVCTLTGTTVTVVAHGLGAAPDEYIWEPHGVSVAQFQSAPGTTNATLSAAPNGAVGMLVMKVNKTIVR